MTDVLTTVIIPTLGVGARAGTLARAVQSVNNQHASKGIPLVVLNGNRFDDDVKSWLEQKRDIRFSYIPESSVSSARLEGVRKSDTEFFCFLDDDDELLPNCLEIRTNAFQTCGPLDLVVTNGFIQEYSSQEIAIPKFDEDPDDHAMAILKNVWLNSASASYNASTIGPHQFTGLPDVLEWTYLGFRLALDGYRILRLNTPTYIIHRTSPDHVTLSEKYAYSSLAVIQKMAKLPMPKSLRSVLEKKYLFWLHDLADTNLRQGNLLRAWKFHILSLRGFSGLRYSSFTRHLVRAGVRVHRR